MNETERSLHFAPLQSRWQAKSFILYSPIMIAILWYGLEWRSTYKFLTQKQWVSPSEITIFDEKTDLELPEWVQSVLWATCYDQLVSGDYDQIWRSPGITNHILQDKLSNPDDFASIFDSIISQTQYFFDHYTGIKIGITGTKGKSQTATVCYMTMQEAWLSVGIAGNIGKPVFDIIDFGDQPDYVVYEMSSFMLESLGEFDLDIWVFNTLYSTHTREHDGFEHYVAAKMRLVDTSETVLIGLQARDALLQLWYTLDDEAIIYGAEWYYTFTTWDPCGVFWVWDQAVLDDAHMLIQWVHNRTNFCSVVGICDLLQIDLTHLDTVFKSFGGLDHRMQNLGTHHNIQWINDAIATTPQATMAAITTYGEQIDTLLYGGIEWDYDHSWVVQQIIQYGIQNLILFPDSGHHIAQWLQKSWYSANILETHDMSVAIAFAKKHTAAGALCLLSCGSPSFSCWSGFEEKGRLFGEFAVG